jgi:hypothetical protein
LPLTEEQDYMAEQYEFSARQNSVFTALRRSARYFAIANLVLGIATLVLAYILAAHEDELFAALVVVGLGLLYGALAVAWRQPLDNIRNITDTENRDIDELMVAAEDLRRAFMISTLVFAGFLLLRLILSFGDLL